MKYSKYSIQRWDKDTHNIRFVIINDETGEIACDANGHGHTTIKKALKAFKYKKLNDSKFQELYSK